MMALDIGPKSIELINKNINNCKTILWNGPLGAFETYPFDKGTNQVALHVSSLTKQKKILSVAGGGDTVSALNNAKVLAIAPPIMIISIFLSKKFITSILVETFDPPIIAATGLLGLFKTPSKLSLIHI